MTKIARILSDSALYVAWMHGSNRCTLPMAIIKIKIIGKSELVDFYEDFFSFF